MKQESVIQERESKSDQRRERKRKTNVNSNCGRLLARIGNKNYMDFSAAAVAVAEAQGRIGIRKMVRGRYSNDVQPPFLTTKCQ